MERLIDANKLKEALIELLENIKQYPQMTKDEMHIIAASHTLAQMIDDAAAVELVRCKDCIYYELGKSYMAYCNNPDNGCICWPCDDDYCSYGERK